jgi:predicted 3-demethylubiquinone-9 3-methyltransferase (glyoxalase superfamily)
MAAIKKLVPCLWFDGNAEEAVNFYTSVFKKSKLGRISYYSEEGKDIHRQPPGSVMSLEFEIEGTRFLSLNGGPDFKFSEAISFIINCKTQKEIDYYWDALKEGGDPNAQQCGWLKDKFGVSWQVIPEQLDDMTSDDDREKVDRVLHAMFPMKKLDLAVLQKAYKGEEVPEHA